MVSGSDPPLTSAGLAAPRELADLSADGGLNAQLSILNSQLSILNSQLSILQSTPICGTQDVFFLRPFRAPTKWRKTRATTRKTKHYETKPF